MAEKNALAELTDRLDTFIALIPCFVEPADEKMLDCMKRIVAELAWACDNGNEGRPWMDVAQQTIMRCRAIAEEREVAK